jgi:hypothetical protein
MLAKYIRTIGPKIVSSKKTTIIVTSTIVFIVFLITFFAAPTQRSVYSLLFDQDVNLSHNTKLLVSPPNIGKYGNNVYVTWAGHNAHSSDIYFKTIRVGGVTTFGSTINLSHNINGSFSGSPQIAAYGNNVYVTWAGHNAHSSDIYFKTIRVGGVTTFGSTINLSHNINGSFSGSPQMALSVHHIYIASMDNIRGNSDIYFRHIKWNLSP